MTLFRLLFSSEIIEIESLDSRAAILDSERSILTILRQGAATGHTTPCFNFCICEKNVHTIQMEPMKFKIIAWNLTFFAL